MSEQLLKKEVALIIVYNHRFDKNIDLLEKLYRNRFTHIFHLMPFYDGNKENVIPIYESSYYFQGHVAQGFKHYFNEKFDYYFFIGDDLLLNPSINENNYKLHLNLGFGACFLPEIVNIHDSIYEWPRVVEAFQYKPSASGIEIGEQLPNYVQALERFESHGLFLKPLIYDQLHRKRLLPSNPLQVKKIAHHIIWKYLRWKGRNLTFSLPYPVIGGYSDIFVIASDSMKSFSNYCGLFAVTKLFAELAIPTAIILSSKKIVQEKDLKLSGCALWTKEDHKILLPYNKNLKNLLDNFPLNHLYLHPIKLSQWK